MGRRCPQRVLLFVLGMNEANSTNRKQKNKNMGAKYGIEAVQPYLIFGGRCEEAINFFRNAVGAEVEMLMHFKDNPDPPQPGCPMPPSDKVMHASIRIGNHSVLVSDGRCQEKPR